jgi:hypothetical protein
VTEWDEFKEIPPETFLERVPSPIVIDGRRVYAAASYRILNDRALGSTPITTGFRVQFDSLSVYEDPAEPSLIVENSMCFETQNPI